MKAIVYAEYGLPEVLQMKDIEKPVPRDDEVLIKIQAVSLNASDWEFLTGKPLYTRIWGLWRPKNQILGSDIAGTVETVGKNVGKFQPEDAVFGDIFEKWGGLAEYVCAPESMLTVIPPGFTFEQAAAIPQAALIALQGLRNKGDLQPGQKVLINGAGGGAGSFAVQLAKHFGAEVTGVDSTIKLEMIRSIGADEVIDYTRDDFTKKGRQYDLILDFVASHSIFDYKRSLASKGKYIMVGGAIPHIFNTLLIGSLISLFSANQMSILGAKPNEGLDDIIRLIESGKVVPVIDRQYPLHQAAEAFRYLGEGKAKGKVVISLRET
jgi:NADPH:quinone reductase-like Zn-dependent oxidoreductase